MDGERGGGGGGGGERVMKGRVMKRGKGEAQNG